MSTGPGPAMDARLRAAIESAPSGLLMIDGRGTIVLVNREIERLFGYPREELLGRPVENLVPSRHRAGHEEFRRGFLGSPSVRAMGAGRELFGLRKDGSEFPVEIGLTPVATEEGLFVISSVVDISARKQAEREREELESQLRQAQKMEAVGRLAGGVAHDFNNILAAILGFAELARDARRFEDARRDLEEVVLAANRGKELVERILRFSRRQELSIGPIDLPETISEAARLLRATLPAAVGIHLDLEPAPRRILADATAVHQVIMNLVTNAAHAMPVGGTIEVGAEPYYARDSFVRAHPGLKEGHYALVRVRDEGTGMDAETQARAFEPFFTTKSAGHGSGLGLSMVHGLVSGHGGATWIESAVGEGTTVRVLFPVPEVGESEDASPEEVPVRGGTECVLLVDDEPQLVRATQRRLETLGYRVVVAESPVAALEAVRARPADFDLVVSDYSMPEMSGVELARELWSLRPELPVLMVSGLLEELPAPERIGSGPLRTLRKPVAGRELARAVREVLDSR
jgi:PAS domain S-box-containing protein